VEICLLSHLISRGPELNESLVVTTDLYHNVYRSQILRSAHRLQIYVSYGSQKGKELLTYTALDD
jgi:hypothetical protein